ncbi:5-oxoprolinase subunit PxpB [Propionivibrio sp.]|uniref:5-oxoprolinase subunit PxpB n=1 Tax=Propionivibrio sp. TaxID=2212460 RepID=UPI0025CEE151|nr:5-oxoprolinase subunit PxpB [Propionivibrio sp.]
MTGMESGAADQSLPVRLLALGDAAWTIEFGTRIDPALHARVLGLADALEQARRAEPGEADGEGREGGAGCEDFAGIVDVVPTFRSLTVHFNPLLIDGQRLGQALLRLAADAGTASRKGRHWRIPVCFDEEFSPDLNDLAQSKGLSREAVIALMSETTFTVYLIGFMPGFPYLGGLPALLEAPRLASPRKAVPARSLAIAGAMCAVYPWQSPGGWRLLGKTPVPMFSAGNAQSPSLLASGDRVCWQAVDRPLYLEIEAAAQAGAFALDSLLLVPGET